MRILQISASYKPAYIYGGPIMSVAKLCEALSKTDTIHTEVYTTLANGLHELDFRANSLRIEDGVAVTYFKRITKDHSHLSPTLYIRLWKTVKSYDLVHIHAWWNLVSVISCFIALLRGVKVILSPRGTLGNYSFHNRTKLLKRIFHLLIGTALLNRCYFHVTSQKEKEDILSLVKVPKGMYVIPNFVKLSSIRKYNNEHTGVVFKLLFLSRIEEKKGLDILLNALAAITIPYHLTIAGDGDIDYINRLKQIAAHNNIEQHISWIGFQQDNKFDTIAQHDLLVLPSHDENFGNVVIESLSVGTAVLISKGVGLAKYIADNKLGWICEANIGSVQNCLTEIYHDPTALNTIEQLSPYIIRNDFNEDNLLKQYLRIYKATLD